MFAGTPSPPQPAPLAWNSRQRGWRQSPLPRGGAMGNPREHLVNWLRNAHAPRDRSSSRRCHRGSARFNLPPTPKDHHHEQSTGTPAGLAARCPCNGAAGRADALGPGLAHRELPEDEGQGRAAPGRDPRPAEAAGRLPGAAGRLAFRGQGHDGHDGGHGPGLGRHVRLRRDRQGRDAETQRVCEQILAQEEAMAQWVLDNLPEVTQTFMLRDAEGVEAKK